MRWGGEGDRLRSVPIVEVKIMGAFEGECVHSVRRLSVPVMWGRKEGRERFQSTCHWASARKLYLSLALLLVEKRGHTDYY